jgi:hypothetical protein
MRLLDNQYGVLFAVLDSRPASAPAACLPRWLGTTSNAECAPEVAVTNGNIRLSRKDADRPAPIVKEHRDLNSTSEQS